MTAARHRMLLVCVAVATLTSACASAPQRPVVNVALAHVRSAELDAANSLYELTLTQAGEEFGAGTLNEDAFRRIYAAGANLHRALTLAAAEQRLYLAGANNLSTYDAAFVKLKQSRRDLELTAERAHRNVFDKPASLRHVPRERILMALSLR